MLKMGPHGPVDVHPGPHGACRPRRSASSTSCRRSSRKRSEIGRCGREVRILSRAVRWRCNSAAYDVSVRAVSDLLGIKLVEIDDWNCCGATEYFSQDELIACSVIARNLALVDPQLDQVVAPCAACYLNLKKTDKLMAEHAGDERQDQRGLAAGGLKLQGRPRRGAPPARRDLHRHRRGGRPRQGGPAADRPARRPVLRLPGRAAASTASTTPSTP